MKNITVFLFCVIVVFFQLSIAGVFFSRGRIPDLALALVIVLVLTMSFKESFWWILLVGACFDLGTNVIFGTAMLAFFLIAWIVSVIAKIADLRSRKFFFAVLMAALVSLAEIAKDFLMLASLKIRTNYSHESAGVSLNLFGIVYVFKLIYTIFAAYAIYYIFRRVTRKIFFEPIKSVRKY
jgi:cell shape-determining protein MreD